MTDYAALEARLDDRLALYTDEGDDCTEWRIAELLRDTRTALRELHAEAAQYREGYEVLMRTRMTAAEARAERAETLNARHLQDALMWLEAGLKERQP